MGEFKATFYEGPGNFYFTKIIDEIIKIGSLKKEKKILDYGCGVKFLEKRLNKKIINFDIQKEFTEVSNIFDHAFDVMVINHVLMYLWPDEIKKFFKRLKKERRNCKFIIGIGRMSFLNKLAAILAFEFDAHKNTRTIPSLQKKIIFDYFEIISHKNVFCMTDIYYLKFK